MNDTISQVLSESRWREEYKWPKGKSCAVVCSFDVDGESPFVWMNRGQPVSKLGEAEQRRFGPRTGVYRIMDLLEQYEVKGTFFVPGLTVEQNPDLLGNILERGHEIGLHGYYHERVDDLSKSENAVILDKSIELFRNRTGLTNFGYRSPSFEMTADMFDLLAERGVLYDSSLMGAEHPYSLSGVTEVPVQWLIDDAIYFRYTSGPRDKGHPANPNSVLEGWIEEFEGLREFKGVFTLTAHPWISGRPQRIRMLRKLFSHIMACDDVWWASAGEIAQYHEESGNALRFDTPATPVNTAV
jgi:peptidoglycan/xylan/chitin deacetylase (PgdA/CDA1 family)